MPRVIAVVLCADLLFLAIAIGDGQFFHGDPRRRFQEGQSGTWVSAAHLVAMGLVAWRILMLRKAQTRQPILRSSLLIWALMAGGFFFLAADELFEIHEQVDLAIHSLFGITETSLTDRIDDLLVLLYLVIGLAAVCIARSELWRYRVTLPFFAAGFVLALAMVVLDVLTNDVDLLRMLLPGVHLGSIFLWAIVAEDVLKVLAEAFFLLGFIQALQMTRRMDAEPSAGPATCRSS
jgi:hypothetical protein